MRRQQNKSANKTGHGSAGKLRIIGGTWRSRLLPVIDAEGLRPTPDRVRETLFNWLMADVANSHCLDLFAGSGALGFEAASRGAEKVVMVEKQHEAAVLLKQNQQLLNARQIQVIETDAIKFLQSSQQIFDIVFLDPPYQAALLNPAILLLQQGWLRPGALIYVESAVGEPAEIPQDWQQLKDKVAGQVHYCLYRAGGD